MSKKKRKKGGAARIGIKENGFWVLVGYFSGFMADPVFRVAARYASGRPGYEPVRQAIQ